MVDIRGLGLVGEIKRRRKEAREMGRLIHPEPLITELRRRKRIQVRLLVLKRIGDFIEGVAAMLRDPVNWQSIMAGEIIGQVISVLVLRR